MVPALSDTLRVENAETLENTNKTTKTCNKRCSTHITVIACLHQNQLTLQRSKPLENQYPTGKSVSQLAVAEIGV